jgi:hypothetical protein
MLELSQRDRDRLVMLRQVAEGRVTVTRAGDLMGLSRRQVGRLLKRFHEIGDAAVLHRGRGKPSNNRRPETIRARALSRAREPLFRDFRPTLLAEHLSRDPEIGPLNPHTLRLWMVQEGLWKPRRHRARHRKARPRRAAFGELIQWDSSEHAWFEERASGRFTLIQMHDDATNRLLMARFVERDSGAANRQILIDYLRRWGRPVAFYTDKAGHFGQWTRGKSPRIPLEERELQRTASIIRTGLETLNIELIQAHSPQAKGRVERNFQTSQDRLVKELRIASVATIEEANRYLDEVYVPFWNRRYAVQPNERRDAHRRLNKTINLERIFADSRTRTVAADFTIRDRNHRWQIPKTQARDIRPGQKISIELRLDGSTHFRFEERYLQLEPVPRTLGSRLLNTKPPTPKPKHIGKPPVPGPNHFLRTGSALLAKPKLIEKLRTTPAAPQPALSTP